MEQIVLWLLAVIGATGPTVYLLEYQKVSRKLAKESPAAVPLYKAYRVAAIVGMPAFASMPFFDQLTNLLGPAVGLLGVTVLLLAAACAPLSWAVAFQLHEEAYRQEKEERLYNTLKKLGLKEDFILKWMVSSSFKAPTA